MVNPHGGGDLKPLLLEGDALKKELERAKTLKQIKISSREVGDVIMMGIGGFTPLDGFMTHADWEGVCDGYKMTSGLFWRKVVRRAPHHVYLTRRDLGISAGDAKVCHLDAPIRRDEHVLRLDVTMDDAAAVSKANTRADGNRDV